MSAERFHIVDVNPNDAVGGGGCLCSESKVEDCDGPYAVFYVHDMASNISPHPVACLDCLRAAVKKAEDSGTVLAGGEVEGVAEELDDEVPGNNEFVVATTEDPIEPSVVNFDDDRDVPEV